MKVLMVLYFSTGWGNGYSGGSGAGMTSQIVTLEECVYVKTHDQEKWRFDAVDCIPLRRQNHTQSPRR